MVKLIRSPAEIKASGNKSKIIREFIGRVNTKTEDMSIAKMESPEGWIEPGQTPDFNEYTVVLKGVLRVRTKKEIINVEAGQAVMVTRGEWVQYSTPYKNGAEYIAICMPAFSQENVKKDE